MQGVGVGFALQKCRYKLQSLNGKGISLLSAERQSELFPILVDFSAVKGVKSVEQDDFDSTSINVFITLDVKEGKETKPWSFSSGIQHIKRGVSRACERHGRACNFLHWPQIEYESQDGERHKKGYDCGYIKVEVYV